MLRTELFGGTTRGPVTTRHPSTWPSSPVSTSCWPPPLSGLWEALEPPATTTTVAAATATGWPDTAEAAGNGTMASGGVPAFSQICRFREYN